MQQVMIVQRNLIIYTVVSNELTAGAISTQRRKIAERGTGVDTPETSRAVGGSDRM